MKFNLTHFFKNQVGAALQTEGYGLDMVELSSADLEAVTGGRRCPYSGSNGSPSYSGSSGSSFGSPSYSGSPSGNASYNSSSSPDSGYGSVSAQVTVYTITLAPAKCPYSSSSY